MAGGMAGMFAVGHSVEAGMALVRSIGSSVEKLESTIQSVQNNFTPENLKGIWEGESANSYSEQINELVNMKNKFKDTLINLSSEIDKEDVEINDKESALVQLIASAVGN